MIYRNGKEILPTELLAELQNYVQGELIYIPKKETNRAGWGERNGTRNTIRMRNHEIFSLYRDGLPMVEIIKRFHLSEDSIKKIISHLKERCVF